MLVGSVSCRDIWNYHSTDIFQAFGFVAENLSIFWRTYFLPCFIISCSRNKQHMLFGVLLEQCMQHHGITFCLSWGHQPRNVWKAPVWSGQRWELFDSRQWEYFWVILPLCSVSSCEISALLYASIDNLNILNVIKCFSEVH